MAGVGAYLQELKEANGKVEDGIFHYDENHEIPEKLEKLVVPLKYGA